MSKIVVTAVVFVFVVSGCTEKPASPPLRPQTSTLDPMADQAVENSRQEARAAAHDARQMAAESATAARDAVQAAAIATRQAARNASVAAKSVTDRLADAGETANQAAAVARETVQQLASAVRQAPDAIAQSDAPMTMPDWLRMPVYDCRACHAIDHKLVGPAWQDVAQRYKNNPQAQTFLMDKVRRGGKGNWDPVTGGVSMPPHPSLSDAELKRVVTFVLSLPSHPGNTVLN